MKYFLQNHFDKYKEYIQSQLSEDTSIKYLFSIGSAILWRHSHLNMQILNLKSLT